MPILRVDRDKCNKDGICVEVCPVSILAMGDEGPVVRHGYSGACIGCGHCVAACPHGALDNVRSPLAEAAPLKEFPVIGREAALAYLRSRRSIRCYRKEPVPRDMVLDLLDIARFAPSGHNTQGISYLVVEGEKSLDRVREIILEWMRMVVATEPETAKHMKFPMLIEAHERGLDLILRNVPQLVVAHASSSSMHGAVSTMLCLEYVELYAAAMGLGTCWAGLLQGALLSSPSLREIVGIPAQHSHHYPMMLGYPKIKRYFRLPERKLPKITFK